MTPSCGSPQPDSRSPGSASRQRPGTGTTPWGEWKDGDTLFLTCQVWRQAAENAAETLRRGMRAIVTGRLRQRSYETQEGEKRTVYELQVDEAGPSLRNATAQVTKTARPGNGQAADTGEPPGSYSDEPPF